MLLRTSSAPSRRAVVLLAVLVIVVLLSLAAYKYNDYMLSEYRAADSSLRATQARKQTPLTSCHLGGMGKALISA